MHKLNKYEVPPIFGMISQDGKTFSWQGKNPNTQVSCTKSAPEPGIFTECSPTMPVMDMREMSDHDALFNLMMNHTVEEVLPRQQWTKNTVCLEEFLATPRRRGVAITTVQQVQEQMTADLHTH